MWSAWSYASRPSSRAHSRTALRIPLPTSVVSQHSRSRAPRPNGRPCGGRASGPTRLRERVLHLVPVVKNGGGRKDLLERRRRRSRRACATRRRPGPPSPRPAPRRRDPGNGSRRTPGSAGTAHRRARPPARASPWRAPPRSLASPSSRARAPVARKPAADEDDEAVQARDAVAAVGERSIGARAPRPFHRRGHAPAYVSADVAAKGRTAPGTDRESSRAPPRGRPRRKAGCRRRCRRPRRARGRAGTRHTFGVERARRARREVLDEKDPDERSDERGDLAVHDRADRDAHQRPEDALEQHLRPHGVSDLAVEELDSSPAIVSHGSATAAMHEQRERAEHERDHVPASAFEASTRSRLRLGEERRRDRAVAELGRDDRDPEDRSRERREPADSIRPTWKRCGSRIVRVEPISPARRCPTSDDHGQVHPPATGRADLEQLRPDELRSLGRLPAGQLEEDLLERRAARR